MENKLFNKKKKKARVRAEMNLSKEIFTNTKLIYSCAYAEKTKEKTREKCNKKYFLYLSKNYLYV